MTIYQQLIYNKCIAELNLASANLSPEYYYDSLPQCIIDAVFSIGVDYAGTRNTVIKYCDKVNIRRISDIKNHPSDVHTVDDLLTNISHFDRNGDCGASGLFDNRRLTSPRGGMLKSIAVRDFAIVLKNNDIQTIADLRAASSSTIEKIEKEIKEIKGQGSGISFSYFLMLSGDDNHMKIDRWLLRFVGDALGMANYNNMSQAYTDLLVVCSELKTIYPELTPRLLDHTIWNYMRQYVQ